MKKRLGTLALLVGLATSCFSWTTTKNFLGDSTCDLLVAGRSAFTVYTDSNVTTTAVRVFPSSMSLVTNAEIFINMNSAGADTINELISSITAQSHWYASLYKYADGTQQSSGTGVTGTAGNDLGLLGSAAPVSYANVYLSSNAATVLFNSTLTGLRTITPDKNRRVGCTQVISSGTLKSVKVEFLDGASVTSLDNTVALPVFTDNVNYKDQKYSEQCPVASTCTGKAFGFKVTFSTWATANDKIELHYFKGE